MIAVSEAWQVLVGSSHTRAHRVDVVFDGDTVLTGIPITGGTVTYDAGDKEGVSAEVQVADPALLPRGADPSRWPLAPYGSALRILSGVVHQDGSKELRTIATVPIVRCPTRVEGDAFTVTCASVLRWVADAKFEHPYTAPADTNIDDEIDRLIRAALPSVTIVHAAGSTVIPRGMTYRDDRLQAVQDLAAVDDLVVLPRRDGSVTVTSPPLPDSTATTVKVIGAGGVLLSGSRPDLDRAERYNAVVVTNPRKPRMSATAYLTTGPARWGGPFGKRPLLVEAPAASDSEALAIARKRLARLAGRSRTIEVQIVPDAALQVGDHVKIRWGGGQDETAVVRRTVLPLGPEPMTVELRGTA